MTESLNERLAENLDLLRKATRLDPVARKAIADVEDAIDALTAEKAALQRELAHEVRVGDMHRAEAQKDSAIIRALEAENERLRTALEDSAKQLHYIANHDGRGAVNFEQCEAFYCTEARAALAGTEEGGSE